MKRKHILMTLLMISTALTGCSSFYKYTEGKVNIVTTTTMLGDLARQIGGDLVAVKALMSVGVDPHSYSAKASDTIALDKSDFIMFGGLHLEGKMVDVFEVLSKKKPYIDSGESIQGRDGMIIYDDKHNPDPHIWFNVQNWIKVAESFTEILSLYDSDNTAYYELRSASYISQLEELHEWIIERAAEIPLDERILVTAHDAFQYFGLTYGFEVEAIQGISTESEASISDIKRLVDLVILKNVKAIFVESSVPQKTIDAVIASARERGHTLNIGGELYSDSLGDGDDGTYINAFKTNVNYIVDALK